MNLPAAIKSANEILALATQHEKKKFIASASVMLTVEMVKISNAINADIDSARGDNKRRRGLRLLIFQIRCSPIWVLGRVIFRFDSCVLIV